MKWTCLWLVCGAVAQALAQTSGPFVPENIYVTHSASRRSPQTPEAALAPGSLFDISTVGLYPPSGSLEWGEPVTLLFRAPGQAEPRDLAILKSRDFNGAPAEFTARVPLDAASGHLCRCTGYAGIRRAIEALFG